MIEAMNPDVLLPLTDTAKSREIIKWITSGFKFIIEFNNSSIFLVIYF